MAVTDNDAPIMPDSSGEEGRPATFGLVGWYGSVNIPIRVLGETPKRYRVRLLADARLPGGRDRRAGDVVLLPKWIVYFTDTEDGTAEGGR